MFLVDSHCHLNFPDYEGNLAPILANAEGAGVRVMQTICTHTGEFPEVLKIAKAYPNIYCSVGIHPNHVHEEPLITSQQLVEFANDPKVIGFGETGLDYHYNKEHVGVQKQSFRAHIAAGREAGIPIIVHSRDADEDTVAVLEEEMEKGAFKGLIHCFSTGRYLAEKSIELGLYVSIAGIVTFKNAKTLQEVVKDLPLDRLLVETDSPYLAPMPYRGKRNEPAYIAEICRFIAELKGVSQEEVAEATTRNFFQLFTKAKRPE